LFVLIPFATGYASQHIWCLSQARINWESCVRKGILRKNGGDGRGVGTKSGWAGSSSRLLVRLLVLSSFCSRKSRVVPDKVQRAVKWLCVCVIPFVRVQLIVFYPPFVALICCL